MLLKVGEDDKVKVKEGLALINSAARQGHTDAMVVLGRADKAAGKFGDAASKFKVAAAKGSAEGSNELGMCYYGDGSDGSGIGVEQR